MSPRGRKPKIVKNLPAYMRVIGEQEAGPEAATRPLGKDEAPSTESTRYAAPDWFEERDRAIFEFLQDHGHRLQILDPFDQIELQILAREVADWQRCQEEIKTWRDKNEGSVTYKVRGRNGTQYKTIPQVAQAAQHLRHIAALGSNFGLSPVDRERLKFLGNKSGEGDQASFLD